MTPTGFTSKVAGFFYVLLSANVVIKIKKHTISLLPQIITTILALRKTNKYVYFADELVHRKKLLEFYSKSLFFARLFSNLQPLKQ